MPAQQQRTTRRTRKPSQQTRASSNVENRSLDKKHRPTALDGLYENDLFKQNLAEVVSRPNPPSSFLFQGPTGCVDGKTEYMSTSGWRPISSYNGEQVLQFENGIAAFTQDVQYIKRKTKCMYHFKTKYGLDQVLSLDHRVLYKAKKHETFFTKPFSEIKHVHETNVYGFTGQFLLAFQINGTNGMPLTDEELRVMVMFIADGTVNKNLAEDSEYKYCVSLKKERKIKRARKLLVDAHIAFHEIPNGQYIRFYFQPCILSKIYSPEFYTCTNEQLHCICDEVFNWDGDKKRSAFFSNNKANVDFIQYAFCATGSRTSLLTTKRQGRNDEYRCIVSKNPYTSMGPKTTIARYVPSDGYEYCFIVPSSYIVLRRNGCVFVTGNCGKTTAARIAANLLGGGRGTVHELNISSLTGVDTARDIESKARFKPFGASKKIYILNECHKASNAFWNAMLETLEEPPTYCHFLLVTTEPQKLLPTVRNRCSVFTVSPLSSRGMTQLLKDVCRRERVEMTDALKQSIRKIARVSEGCCRQALLWLDQIIDIQDPDRMINTVQSFTLTSRSVLDLYKALVHARPWDQICSIISALEEEPERVRVALMSLAERELMRSGNLRAYDIIEVLEKSPIYHRSSLTCKCFELSLPEE